MKRRNWVPAEDAVLRAMKVASASAADIGAVLGRTEKAVKRRANELGARCGDPAVARARVLAASLAVRRSPEGRAAASAGHRAAWAQQPERRAVAAERARAQGFAAIGRAAIEASPETRARRRARVLAMLAQRNERRLAWCPVYLRAEYLRMATLNGLHAAERRRIILEHFGRDLRRAVRAIAAIAAEQHKIERAHYRTFEAELARVASGQTRAVVRVPMVRADYQYSLTGGSMA
jgi:hypothetical protein